MHCVAVITRNAFLLGLCVFATACATTHPVSFTSEPAGALVVAGEQSGRTPVTLHLPRGDHVVTVSLDNTTPRIVPVSRPGAENAVMPHNVRRAAGGVLRVTGSTLNAIGEVGLHALGHTHSTRGDAEAVVWLGVAVVSLSAVTVGRAMTHAGGEWLEDEGPAPASVHVVFDELLADDSEPSTGYSRMVAPPRALP